MRVESDKWKEWIYSKTPEEESFPQLIKIFHLSYQNDTTGFLKLLFLRFVRPDRFDFAMEKYLRDNNKDILLNSPGGLREAIDNINKSFPLYIMKTDGIIPYEEITKIFEKKRGSSKENEIHFMSLSKSSLDRVEGVLQEASMRGNWIVLININILPSWTVHLYSVLKQIVKNAHSFFRLIIITEDNNRDLNYNIGRHCLKYSYDSSYNIKSSIHRSWNLIYNDRFTAAQKIPIGKLYYGLSLLHSLCINRNRFGNYGWSKPYSFDNILLKRCAEDILEFVMNDINNIDYDAIKWLITDISYNIIYF